MASIKASAPGGRGAGIRMLPGARLNAQNASAHFLIEVAYRVRAFQVIGGPSWVEDKRWDVTARGPDRTPDNQLRPMMQSMLADRFRMKTHRETRVMPVYFLTVAKGGLKLPNSKEGGCVQGQPGGPPPTPGQPPPCGMMRVGPGGLDAARIDMAELILFFSDALGRAVIDKTDFKGTFDAHLEFTRDEALNGGIFGPGGAGGGPQQASDSNFPNIFTAAQEQLGLCLESGKGPVDVLVIDSIERPTEN